ncbi:MAG TPA: ABC transporter permease [Prolixibacteraceae bacterium]
MVKFKVIFRGLLRQKLNTGIIIASLAIGMACMNLIALFIQRELSTDGFQTWKDRIYALKCDNNYEKDPQIFMCGSGSVEYMKNNFAQIEDFCRVDDGSVPMVVVNKEIFFDGPKIIAASKNFFDFFSYKLLTNNPKTALAANNNLVISEDLALKYFGSADAVGQVITLANGDRKETMEITGIFRKPVDNSQLNFDIVRSITGLPNSPCYLRLRHGERPTELEAIFKANKNSIPGTSKQYHLELLGDSYFDASPGSRLKSSRDKTDLWIALVIGLIIICIASFNYLGLINNNLIGKNKAYAIQRVNGGSKFSFVFNFMAESFIVVGLSFILSLFIMLWLLPFFNGLTNTNITLGFVFHLKQILILCAIVALLLIITLLFVGFRITTDLNLNVLKPGSNHTGKRVQFPAFNIFQLAGSLVLIIFSVVIIKQTNYITQKPIGLDKQVIEVKIPGQYSNKIPAFKEELIANSSIRQVSIADSTPFQGYGLYLLKYMENGAEKQVTLCEFYGDENYVSTLGIQILEGFGFSGNPLADKDKFLINESLARLFPDQNLIGKGLPGWEKHIVAGTCCFISVSLSMIGLFAISFQSSLYRTKEIGIRKINGARVSEVMTMLNRDFVKWVAIAFIIATPIAWYAMNKWLESFAYKTTLSWWIFVLAGLMAMGIALLTVSWQSWKAATRNPVEALRYE